MDLRLLWLHPLLRHSSRLLCAHWHEHIRSPECSWPAEIQGTTLSRHLYRHLSCHLSCDLFTSLWSPRSLHPSPPQELKTRLFRQLALYPIVFALCWVPATVARFVEVFDLKRNHDLDMFLTSAHVLLRSLAGFFNFVIFVVSSRYSQGVHRARQRALLLRVRVC